MRNSEILPIKESKVGREYQHLEDLVIVDGSAGAVKAADLLSKIYNKKENPIIKWDGQLAVYFGRESDGTFVFVGKNGWGKNKSTSSSDLKKFILSTGKGEEWRQELAVDLSRMFDIVEQNLSKDFRGFYFADVLYHPGKPYKKDKESIIFTPNKVTYEISKASELGTAMSNSKVAFTVHLFHESFGDTNGVSPNNVSDYSTNEMVLVGPTTINHSLKLSDESIFAIQMYAKMDHNEIDSFLSLKPGLADLKNILYTYVNQSVKGQMFNSISQDHFLEWLRSSKVSRPKQYKIYELIQQNPKSLGKIFGLMQQIVRAKNKIIDHLDDASEIKTSIADKPGGEGYVLSSEKIKLVPRHHWIPA